MVPNRTWPIFDVVNSFPFVARRSMAPTNDLGNVIVPQFHDPPPYLALRRVGGLRKEDAKQQHKHQKTRLGADACTSRLEVRSQA
jgi:hypothetical protein